MSQDITINVKLNTQGFQRSLQQIKNSLNNIDLTLAKAELQQISAVAEDTGGGLERLISTIRNVGIIFKSLYSVSKIKKIFEQFGETIALLKEKKVLKAIGTGLAKVATLAWKAIKLPLIAIQKLFGAVIKNLPLLWKKAKLFGLKALKLLLKGVAFILKGVQIAWKGIMLLISSVAFVAKKAGMLAIKAMKLLWTGITTAFKGIKFAWLGLIKILTSKKLLKAISIGIVKAAMVAWVAIKGIAKAIMLVFKGIMIALKVVKLIFTAPILLIVTAVAAVIAIFIALGQRFEWIQNIIEGVRAAFERAGNFIRRLFGGSVEETADVIEESGDRMAESANTTSDSMIKSYDNATSNIADSFSTMSLNTMGSMDEMMAGLTATTNSGTSQITSAYSGMANNLTSTMSNISDICTSQFANLTSNLGSSASAMNSDVSSQFASLNTHAAGQMGKLGQASNTSMQGMEGDLRTQMAAMKRTVDKAFKQMAQSVKRHLTQALNILRQQTQAMTGALNPLRASLQNVGQSAMQGLNQGLLAGQGQVLNTARNIANQVRATMQAALRISSPSRVMRDDVGGPITDGVASGIDAGQTSVFRVASNFSKNLSDAFSIEPSVDFTSLIGGSNNLSPASATGAPVNNYAGMFDGANIHWHNKADIRETMEEIAWATQRESARMW